MLNATRACELLVGLPAVNVLAVTEPLVGRLEVTIESRLVAPACPGCGERAWVKDRPVVELVDLTCFGRPVTLQWRKHRWHCPRRWCRIGSWTHEDPAIEPPWVCWRLGLLVSNPGGVGLLGSVERCLELGGGHVTAVAVEAVLRGSAADDRH